MNNKIFEMKFSKVYPLLITKAERKGRIRQEVHTVTRWLTGYTHHQLEEMLFTEINYKEFFDSAPAYNPNAELIKGVICGVRVEDIKDETMKKIRQLDKLVDELAKGKSIDKILK